MAGYRFHYIGRVAPDDQRLWRGVNPHGEAGWYLSDESGDGLHGRIGKPTETDDGPLRVNLDQGVRVDYGPRNGRVHCRVTVEHADGTHAGIVGLTLPGAIYLAETLGMALWIEGRRAVLAPAPAPVFECVEGHPNCIHHEVARRSA